MRIRLNCLACGHQLELGDAYEDYQGPVRCWGCRAVLEVSLQEGKLRAMKRAFAGPASGMGPPQVPEPPVQAKGSDV